MKGAASGGFSLVEAMIVVGLFALLVAMAVPSFREWLDRSRVLAAAGSVADGLRMARHEAVQRGARTRFEIDARDGARWTACVLPSGAVDCDGARRVETQNVLATGDMSEVAGVGVGASTSPPAPGDLAVPISGGVPVAVEFDGAGRPLGTGRGVLARIDTRSLSFPKQRMVTLISRAGMVRNCDPQVSTRVHAGGCEA